MDTTGLPESSKTIVSLVVSVFVAALFAWRFEEEKESSIMARVKRGLRRKSGKNG